jgi:hypothetical protein
VKASVGEDDIEFSPLFNEFINRAFSRFDIRYIGLQCEQVIAERLGSRLQGLWVTAGDCHPRAFADEQPGGSEPNAAITTGDRSNFVVEFHEQFSILVVKVN